MGASLVAQMEGYISYLTPPFLFNLFKQIFEQICKMFGEDNGTPLQYSCLENPMGGGAWRAAVHGVTEGQTRVSTHTHVGRCRREVRIPSNFCRTSFILAIATGNYNLILS